MKSRLIIWSLVALIFGLGVGLCIGYNYGYDQAINRVLVSN